MTTVVFGSSAGSGLRPDLGMIGTPWLERYGEGPESQRVALRCCQLMGSDRDGNLSFAKKNVYKNDDPANPSIRRQLSAPVPQRAPSEWATVSVTFGQYGEAIVLSEDDPKLKAIRSSGGAAAGDQFMAEASLTAMLERLDYHLLSKLGAATSPFNGSGANADVAVTSAWTAGTTTIVRDFMRLRRQFGAKLNWLLIDETAWTYLLEASELVDRYGGNQGAGGLSEEMGRSALATMGFKNVFVTEAGMGLGAYAVAGFSSGGSNALIDAAPAVFVWEQNRSAAAGDPRGISYEERAPDYGIKSIYASVRGDFAIIPDNGVRLTGLY